MDQFQQPASNPTTSLFQMNLDAQNSYALRSSASWAKVTGVVGVLLGVFFAALAAITMSKLSSYNGYGYRRGSFDNFFGGSLAATRTGLWIFFITGVIFILGGVFSFNFGNRISNALRSNDQNGLNSAFSSLRNYYAVRGITLIIVLLFFLLVFAGNM